MERKIEKFDQTLAWKTHQARLVAWVQKQGFNRADAEDIVQDIFIKAWNNRNQLKDQARLQSWLFSIARTTIIDFVRSQKRIDPYELTLETNEKNTLIEMEDCIAPFISSLSQQDQEILHEVELKGISQKEYAHQSGANYSTVKSRLQKARQALATRYRQCCHIQQDKQGRISDIETRNKNCDC